MEDRRFHTGTIVVNDSVMTPDFGLLDPNRLYDILCRRVHVSIFYMLPPR